MRETRAQTELYIATGGAGLTKVLVLDMPRTYISLPQPTESVQHERERKGQTHETGSGGRCTLLNMSNVSVPIDHEPIFVMHICTTSPKVDRDVPTQKSKVMEGRSEIHSDEG